MGNLFVLGDSISMGYGQYLAKYLPEDWHYARKTAIPGNTTFATDDNGGNSERCLHYLQHRLENADDFQPDVLLLNCGLHDIRRDPETDALSIPIDQYDINLRESRRIIVSHGIHIIWVTTTPVDDAQHRQHESSFVRRNQDVLDYATVAAAVFAEDIIIDLYTITQHLGASGMTLYGDHVHFFDEVCRLQGAYIAGALAQALT